MLGFKLPKEYRILLAEHMIVTELAALKTLDVDAHHYRLKWRDVRINAILQQLELTLSDLSLYTQELIKEVI